MALFFRIQSLDSLYVAEIASIYKDSLLGHAHLMRTSDIPESRQNTVLPKPVEGLGTIISNLD